MQKVKTEKELKELVQARYTAIAKNGGEGSSCGCSSGCCCGGTTNIMSEDYSKLGGYNPDADLHLGCGTPTEFARIKKGDTVIDLGSGAGNDCFVARSLTGENGKVIGIDFTPAMLEAARANAAKLEFSNVEFKEGDIEKMPLQDNTADVVISNCVLNLVPNKQAVFKEIYRVLKKGGHFSISDVVLNGELPDQIKNAAEMYSGCVSGATQREAYLSYVKAAGFTGLVIQSEKTIVIPDDELAKYLSADDIKGYKQNPDIIRSITVYAEK